jgi:hypothetical protein
LLARSTSQQQRQHKQKIGQYLEAAERHAPRGLANKIPCTEAAARQCVDYGAAVADHAGQYCSVCKILLGRLRPSSWQKRK